MSHTEHKWHAEKPPKPDVYTTRRNESKYLTLRYWDGEAWWEINWGANRGWQKFDWPKGSRTRRPSWAVTYKDRLRLRRIGAHQGVIQWGDEYKVYDEKEVLAYLVKTSRLPKDWKTCFQNEMRGAA